MKNDLAPIALSTYSRLGHLKKNIEALQKNELAKESELYIFSDAPKLGDEEKVQAVRAYLKTIEGFKDVYIYEREENNRVENNRGGMGMLLDQCDKIIFLEEDIVVAPSFLKFMNGALDFYQNDKSIFSISGYSPPFNILDSYEKDVFVLPRFCAWGSGMYKRTFEVLSQPIDRLDFESLQDKTRLSVAGEDVARMVEQEINGKIDAGDVRCMYYQALHSKYTVYPRKSLVQNIGHDGSGVHCGKSDRFYHDTLWDKSDGFTFADNIQPDARIMRENFNFRRVSLKSRLMGLISETPLDLYFKKVKKWK